MIAARDELIDRSTTMAYLWMLLGCFSFAWMGQFAGLLKDNCDWRIVALARAGLVFLFAASIARGSGAKLVVFRPPALWMRSLAGSISLICTFYAYSRLRPSEVLTLTNTFPIWVAILSWPLLHQRPGLAVWCASFCGVAGVALMQVDKGEAPVGTPLAVALALMAAFTSAVAMLGLNRLQGLNPWAIVAHFSGVAMLFVLGAWFAGEFPSLEPLADRGTLGLLLGIGMTATFGQWCLTHAFTSGQPARVSIVGLTQIVWAMLLELAFGGKGFSLTTLAGTALVMAPTAWVMATRAARPGEVVAVPISEDATEGVNAP
jgi:drug/metabolite transporter (DMT)-like permease